MATPNIFGGDGNRKTSRNDAVTREEKLRLTRISLEVVGIPKDLIDAHEDWFLEELYNKGIPYEYLNPENKGKLKQISQEILEILWEVKDLLPKVKPGDTKARELHAVLLDEGERLLDEAEKASQCECKNCILIKRVRAMQGYVCGAAVEALDGKPDRLEALWKAVGDIGDRFGDTPQKPKKN